VGDAQEQIHSAFCLRAAPSGGQQENPVGPLGARRTLGYAASGRCCGTGRRAARGGDRADPGSDQSLGPKPVALGALKLSRTTGATAAALPARDSMGVRGTWNGDSSAHHSLHQGEEFIVPEFLGWLTSCIGWPSDAVVKQSFPVSASTRCRAWWLRPTRFGYDWSGNTRTPN
ncbi:unnamed protein product, partial [Cladocopium goreaui]